MFFQIEDICAQHSDDAIRRTIGCLPRDLPATYQRALERVVMNHKAEVARKMFRWVAAAKRPLSLMEIREAIAVEPCQPFSHHDKLVNDVYQLIPWCGNLLVLDEEECLVQFAHHSVKDYLLSGELSQTSSLQFRLRLEDVDQYAGEICCTYLNFSDFEREIIYLPQVPGGLDPKAIVETSLSANSSPTLTSSLLRLNNLRKPCRATEDSALWRQLHLTSLKVATMSPQNLQTRYYFLAYASEYWLHHTSKFDQENQCWSLFRRLVLTEKTPLATRPWSTDEWKAFGTKVQDFMLKTEHRALLRLANLERLIYARADLCWAKFPSWRSDELFQFHIKATRLVEDFWSTWDPVLIIAAERRRPDWVKKVLELAGGFDSVLAQNKAKNLNPTPTPMDASLARTWRSAWQQAKREGTCEMLDLLLTYKATILVKVEERGYQELHAAALAGNLDLTRRLLDVGVDPNVAPSTQPPSFNSILAAAASGGSLEVVEHLLYAGAEVNSQKVGLKETPLLAAVNLGNMLIVIALLAAGADVNADLGRRNLTPLAAAAGHQDVMVLLLLVAGAKFKGLGCFDESQDWSDKVVDETITRLEWLPYASAEDADLSYYRVHSSFPPREREFFHALKNYVKRSCGNDKGSIKVKEAVESFLQGTRQPRKKAENNDVECYFSPGDAASEEKPWRERTIRVTKEIRVEWASIPLQSK